MKKLLTILLISFMLAFTAACQDTLNNAAEQIEFCKANPDDESCKTPEVIIKKAPSAYSYLGVMYDATMGKDIQDAVLTGAVYDKYSTRIKNAVNAMNQFPLQTLGSSITTNDFFDTLPEEIKTIINSTGKGFAEGLIEYFKTDAGQNQLETTLDTVITNLNKTISYTDDVSPTPFDADITDVINTSLQVSDSISEAVAAFTSSVNSITVGYQIVNIAADFLGFGGGPSAVEQKLDQIINMLQDIQVRLDRIEKKIDKMMATLNALDDFIRYVDVKKARTRLESIYNNLNIFNATNDNAGKQAFLNELLVQYHSENLDNLFDDAFNAANDAHLNMINKYNENNIPLNITIKGYKSVSGCEPTGVHPTSNYIDKTFTPFSTKKITHFLQNTYSIDNTLYGVNIQDLQLLKRMSLSRLTLFEYVYNNNTLLIKRKEFSEMDLNNKLKPLKAVINAALHKISVEKTRLKEEYDIMENTTSQYIMYSVTNYNNNTTLFEAGCDPMEGTIFYQPGHSYVVPTNLNNVKNHINNLIDQYFDSYNKEYQDYLIAAYAIIADWEIRLRAHIKAGDLTTK